MKPHFITSHRSMVVCSASRASMLFSRHETMRMVHGLLSISDPLEIKRPHARFFVSLAPNTLKLDFDDTERESTDIVHPTMEHVEQIVGFGRRYDGSLDMKLLIHCFAGRSRSTAAAFIILCDRYGNDNGGEKRAMKELLTACEKAPLPNMLMVRHADKLLGRAGRMVKVAQRQNDSPEDAECEGGKPVTGTALLAAVKAGKL